MNLFDEIIDGLLEAEPQSQKDKNLEITSQLGRSAIELEQSKAFQDLIPPFTKKTLTDCMKEIIVRGIQMPKEESNVLVAKMQSALNIYALIRDKKKEAVEANKVLNKEKEVEKRRKDKEDEFQRREKKRLNAIRKLEKKKKKEEEKK